MTTELNQLELALSFISEQPHAAARIMEQQPLEQTCSFVATIPLNYQAMLVENLQPAYAARMMERLEDEETASIAGTLEASALSRVLRQMSAEKTEGILQGLRIIKRNSCELLLNYPNYSVGAWMNPDLAIVSVDMTVKEARSYLENTYQSDDAEAVYVTDREGRLEGRLPCLDLIKAKPIQRVHELMHIDPPWMSPNFLLEEAEKSYLWENNDMVVVTDKDMQVLGLLKHADLRLGLNFQEERKPPEIEHDHHLIASLASTYRSCLMVLFNTVLDVVETDIKS